MTNNWFETDFKQIGANIMNLIGSFSYEHCYSYHYLLPQNKQYLL